MYTISEVEEVGKAQDLILITVKSAVQADDDELFTQPADEFDE